jgi:hypothetical protein
MKNILAITLLFCIIGCASRQLPLIQFRDVEKQTVNNNRVLFICDVDINPLFIREGTRPKEVITIQSFGRTYVTAEGFKNLYRIVPNTDQHVSYEIVKLNRTEALPFEKVKFVWAENEQVTFKWKDSGGVYENTIDKKGKAR